MISVPTQYSGSQGKEREGKRRRARRDLRLHAELEGREISHWKRLGAGTEGPLTPAVPY